MPRWKIFIVNRHIICRIEKKNISFNENQWDKTLSKNINYYYKKEKKLHLLVGKARTTTTTMKEREKIVNATDQNHNLLLACFQIGFQLLCARTTFPIHLSIPQNYREHRIHSIFVIEQNENWMSQFGTTQMHVHTYISGFSVLLGPGFVSTWVYKLKIWRKISR